LLAEEQHQGCVLLRPPEPPAAAAEAADTGLHAPQVQGGEPEPAAAHGPAAQVHLQEHLRVPLPPRRTGRLLLQGSLKRSATMPGSDSSVFDFKQPARNLKISTTYARACNANAGH
jgi:hypothetical protein